MFSPLPGEFVFNFEITTIFFYFVGEQLTNDTVAMILQVNER